MTKQMHRLTAAGLLAAGVLMRIQAQLSLPPGSGQLHILQTPPSLFGSSGYPLFLYICNRLFSGYVPDPVLPIQLIQQMLTGLTAALLFTIVYLLLARPKAAWLVCAVYWLHPGVIRSSLHVSSETVYGFVNALLLLCVVLFFRNSGHPRTIGLLSGIFFGIGCIIQPGAAPYLLLFIGIGGLQCFLTHKRTSPYLLALLGCTLGLCPWWLGQLLFTGT